jgi:hypothetical protein
MKGTLWGEELGSRGGLRSIDYREDQVWEDYGLYKRTYIQVL